MPQMIDELKSELQREASDLKAQLGMIQIRAAQLSERIAKNTTLLAGIEAYQTDRSENISVEQSTEVLQAKPRAPEWGRTIDVVTDILRADKERWFSLKDIKDVADGQGIELKTDTIGKAIRNDEERYESRKLGKRREFRYRSMAADELNGDPA